MKRVIKSWLKNLLFDERYDACVDIEINLTAICMDVKSGDYINVITNDPVDWTYETTKTNNTLSFTIQVLNVNDSFKFYHQFTNSFCTTMDGQLDLMKQCNVDPSLHELLEEVNCTTIDWTWMGDHLVFSLPLTNLAPLGIFPMTDLGIIMRDGRINTGRYNISDIFSEPFVHDDGACKIQKELKLSRKLLPPSYIAMENKYIRIVIRPMETRAYYE